VNDGLVVAGGRWFEGDFELVYGLAPPGVYADGRLLLRDDSLHIVLGYRTDPADVDVPSAPLFDRANERRPAPGPAGGRPLRELVDRLDAFLLPLILQADGAERIRDRLGRFALQDPAVQAARIDDGTAVIEVADAPALRFPVPDARSAARVRGAVARALDRVGDAAATLAWFVDGRTVRVADPAEAALVRALLDDSDRDTALPWLLHVLSERVDGCHVATALRARYGGEAVGRLSSATGSAYPAGARHVRRLPGPGGTRVALACRDVSLRDLERVFRDPGPAFPSFPYALRPRTVSWLSREMETPGAMFGNLAAANGLVSGGQAGGSLDERKEFLALPEEGRGMWTRRGVGAGAAWARALPPVVLVPVPPAEVVALDWRSGEEAWRREIGSTPDPPLVGQRTFYFGTSDGAAVAIDASTGKIVWGRYVSARAGGLEPAPPPLRPVALLDGLVAFVQGEEILVIVDANTGAPRRSERLASAETAGAGEGGPPIVFATPDRLVAIGPRSGSVRATRERAFGRVPRIESCGGTWVVDDGRELSVVDAGLEPVSGIDLGAGAIWCAAGDRIVRAGPSDAIEAFAPASAIPVAALRLPSLPRAAASGGEDVYIAAADGFVYRVDIRAGRVRSRFPFDVPPGRPMELHGIGLFCVDRLGGTRGARLR
jgi:hypothetical protein